MYRDKALVHARKLQQYYITPLRELRALDEEDLEDSLWLFLSSYFLDDAFDSNDRPYALAAGLYLYTGYVRRIQGKHPEMMPVLDDYFRLQMIYQSAEKDKVNEKGFDLSYVYDAGNYHMKQIILLFPLELSRSEEKDEIYQLFIHYFDCILLVDDIQDAEEDMGSGTITSVTFGCSSHDDVLQAIAKCKEAFQIQKESAVSINNARSFPSETMLDVLNVFNNII